MTLPFELARTPALRLRSWALDVAVATVVTALAAFGSTGEANPKVNTGSAAFLHRLATHQPGWAYALVIIGGVALVWRRRYPMTVLAVAVGTAAAYSALGYAPGAALSGAYVALFTVATIEARPVAMLAGLGSIVLLFVTSGVGGLFGWLSGGNTVMPPFAIAAVALGIAVASRRQVMAAIIERAERAEHDRDAEARRRVDAERLRIARELHDVVAHSMSMINVQAGVAAHVLPTRPEQAAHALAAIKTASREGLQELRAILNVMRQVDDERVTSPAPGLAQLDALAAATTQAGVPTTVRVLYRRGAVGPAGPAARSGVARPAAGVARVGA
ncbi:MAG: sensor histidine kinase, partial [Acidimicrobiales bacterium]